MTVLRFFLFVILCCVSAAPFALAEPLPLEITADHALEWNQTAKTYTARGAVKAVQGDLSVEADLLQADYAGENGSTSDLTNITADGHVVLKSAKGETATGAHAVYDLVGGTVTLTGSKDSRPRVIKGSDALEADRIVVYLTGSVLDHAEATGSVVITTSGENKATGDKATYTQATNVAELIGHVKIMQGINWLKGDQATMNLTTKVSQITGQKNSPRVKGIFYPSAGKKK